MGLKSSCTIHSESYHIEIDYEYNYVDTMVVKIATMVLIVWVLRELFEMYILKCIWCHV